MRWAGFPECELALRVIRPHLPPFQHSLEGDFLRILHTSAHLHGCIHLSTSNKRNCLPIKQELSTHFNKPKTSMKKLLKTSATVMSLLLLTTIFTSSCQHHVFLASQKIIEKKVPTPPFEITDTIRGSLKDMIDFRPAVDFAFCPNELIAYLAEDTAHQRIFEENLQSRLKPTGYSTLFTAKFVYHNSFAFLKDQLQYVRPELQSEAAYKRLMTQLDTMIFIPLKNCEIIRLVRQFGKTGGAGFWEYSDVYYALLVQYGTEFIDIIKQDKEATILFMKWMIEIERYEFTAFYGGEFGGEIIERKRTWLIELFAKEIYKDEIRTLTYNSIRYAETSIVE